MDIYVPFIRKEQDVWIWVSENLTRKVIRTSSTLQQPADVSRLQRSLWDTDDIRWFQKVIGSLHRWSALRPPQSISCCVLRPHFIFHFQVWRSSLCYVMMNYIVSQYSAIKPLIIVGPSKIHLHKFLSHFFFSLYPAFSTTLNIGAQIVSVVMAHGSVGADLTETSPLSPLKLVMLWWLDFCSGTCHLVSILGMALHINWPNSNIMKATWLTFEVSLIVSLK